ncbi:MAG: hypothetical protein M3069_25310, partial [Chloroflexota bacterium]|nr:hypothetical protein [Chloroflexota bacterium]
MRDRLRQVFIHRRGVLGLAGTTLAVLAAVWLFATSSLNPNPTPTAIPPVGPTEPPPQAAASAPEPTLAALAQATDVSVESSPFAGIAVPPAQPPRRSG